MAPTWHQTYLIHSPKTITTFISFNKTIWPRRLIWEMTDVHPPLRHLFSSDWTGRPHRFEQEQEHTRSDYPELQSTIIMTTKVMPITKNNSHDARPDQERLLHTPGIRWNHEKTRGKEKITWLIVSHLPRKSKMHQLTKNNEIYNKTPVR